LDAEDSYRRSDEFAKALDSSIVPSVVEKNRAFPRVVRIATQMHQHVISRRPLLFVDALPRATA
jgi:hypothetical protein